MSPHGCTGCGTAWLAVGGDCPGCGGPLEATGATPPAWPIEQVEAFALDRDALRPILARALEPVPFPCADLTVDLLVRRAARAYVPRWLIDVRVAGTWQAEVGADYTVSSTQERLAHGRWESHEVEETRIRWASRVGELVCDVPNVVVAATTDPLDAFLAKAPGELGSRVDAPVLLPDRDPAAAWPLAQDAVRAAAADVVRAALTADHVRELYLTADPAAIAWTWRLQPVWISWYRDSAGERRRIAVHGASGEVGGARCADPDLGRQRALLLGGGGAAALVVGTGLTVIGLILWPLLVVSLPLIVAGLVLGARALAAATTPRTWNRAEAGRAL